MRESKKRIQDVIERTTALALFQIKKDSLRILTYSYEQIQKEHIKLRESARTDSF